MSEIADAIHADAEAARAEIRAAGIACPSCGVNMADLPEDHELPLPGNLGASGLIVTCNKGVPVTLPDCYSDEGFKVCQAVANVTLWDAFRKAEEQVWRETVFGDDGHRESADGFPGFLGQP